MFLRYLFLWNGHGRFNPLAEGARSYSESDMAISRRGSLPAQIRCPVVVEVPEDCGSVYGSGRDILKPSPAEQALESVGLTNRKSSALVQLLGSGVQRNSRVQKRRIICISPA
jgi:hypothetical protein